MTTFIPYQPRENAPSFRRNTIRKSPTIGLSNWVLRQSSQHAELARPRAGVGFVDSAAFDHQDLVQERLVAREILESVDYDSTQHRAQVARDDDDDNDDDNDHDSEASELPSLQEVFAKVDEEFRGSDDLSDNEARVNPTADTDTSVPPGASQESPIVLDDDESGDRRDAATPANEEPAFEVTNIPDQCGSPSTLSAVLAESDTNDGKNTPNSLTQHTMHGCGDEEEERGEDLQENVLPHSGNFACGDGNCDGIGSDAPASAGLICDVFAEYEKTFGMPRRKQKTARSALHSCNYSDSSADPVPRSLHPEEPLTVTDDGGRSIEQPTEVADSVVGPGRFLRRESEDGSTSQPRQESDRQRTETEDVRSEYLSTFTSDYYLESAFTQNTLSTSCRTADQDTRSNASAAIQGQRTRKRSRSSTKPAILLNDGAGRKRPRRATKETWKAKEAREELEAKWSQASSDPHPKKPVLSSCPPCGRCKEDGRIAEIEDAYLGEDGSIQCVVTWKSSLIAIENLVSGELQQRCKELFGKRYGQRELQKRAVTKRPTNKE